MSDFGRRVVSAPVDTLAREHMVRSPTWRLNRGDRCSAFILPSRPSSSLCTSRMSCDFLRTHAHSRSSRETRFATNNLHTALEILTYEARPAWAFDWHLLCLSLHASSCIGLYKLRPWDLPIRWEQYVQYERFPLPHLLRDQPRSSTRSLILTVEELDRHADASH